METENNVMTSTNVLHLPVEQMPTAPISTVVSAVLARTVSPEMHQLLTMTTLVTTKSQLSLQQKLQLRLKKQQPLLLHPPQLLLN
jgi:hypothetical protein